MDQIASTTIRPAVFTTYITLNFVGIGLLLALVLTFLFAPKALLHRDATLINVFIVLILVNMINTMYWVGHGGTFFENGLVEEDTAHRAHTILCKAQASLQAGSQAAQAAAVFSLCFRLWTAAVQLTLPWFHHLRKKWFLVILLALPYCCIIAFIPPIALVGPAAVLFDEGNGLTPLQLPSTNQSYLVSVPLDRNQLEAIYQNLALGFTALALLIEIHLIYLVSHHFRHTRASNAASDMVSSHYGVAALSPDRSIKLFFFIRVALFISWTLLMLAATLNQSFDRTLTNPQADMMFACMAPLAFVCFATQYDVLRVWRVPTSKAEWKQLLTRTGQPSPVRVSVATAPGETDDDLGWAEFLGSSGPDTDGPQRKAWWGRKSFIAGEDVPVVNELLDHHGRAAVDEEDRPVLMVSLRREDAEDIV
ncbi:hypothetical protein P7C73_g3264, partial [Tremellales sp. Uapishka_1]